MKMRFKTMTFFLLALCTTCGAREPNTNAPDDVPASKQTPLEIAVADYKTHLFDRGKSNYASLLSVERVRHAIRTGIESYETLLARDGEPNDGAKAHFKDHSKPIYLAIADEDMWPHGSKFDAFFLLTDQRGIQYDGFGLRLHVDTPNTKYQGFAMPIVDVYFGRFPDASKEPISHD